MRGSGLQSRGSGGSRSRKSRRLLVAGAVAAGGPFVLLAMLLWATPDPRMLLAGTPEPTLEVVDRHGSLLRLTAGAEGVRFQPVTLSRVSPHLIHAVLAGEDRRFFQHPGIDPIAVARAAWCNLRVGRIVSGGSTLTMQLARVLDPHPRSWRAKGAQALLALRFELACSKDEIFEAYLSRAPMGNQVVGYGAASRVYLGKPASQLSPAEAALLVAIPRAPSRRNPWRWREALLKRRDQVLEGMVGRGFLTAAAGAAALAEPVVLARDPLRTPAPHFLARLAEDLHPLPAAAVRVVSTLDLTLQQRVETIVTRRLAELAQLGVHHMAVVVLDVNRDEWLAMEGSGGFWERPGGQIDGTCAPRQPGSALKPFTYAVAFDHSHSPAELLADLPRAFTWSSGTWVPRNYDGAFHGPLRAREALACSVNVPAVQLLAELGPDRLLELLEQAGITTLGRGAGVYGLGLTLGAGEARLDELTAAYAALLRGGEWHAATTWRAVLADNGDVLSRAGVAAPVRVCSREAAAQVVDILADPGARARAFGRDSVLRLPFPAAVKTGTSEGFRDNWCVGGTRDVAVGVWCGSFDRAPMGNVSGVTGAGGAWREVMLAWAELVGGGLEVLARRTLPGPSSGLVRTRVCALSGLAPGPHCPVTVAELLRPEQVPGERCSWHERDADGRTIVRWPPEYRDWAVREGLLAVDGVAGSQGVARGAANESEGAADELLAVTMPAHGDAFIVSPDLPRRFQTLELRCVVRGNPAEVSWRVDGEEHCRSTPPYSASWELRPGAHTIQVAAGPFRSHPVAITVYGK